MMILAALLSSQSQYSRVQLSDDDHNVTELYIDEKQKSTW